MAHHAVRRHVAIALSEQEFKSELDFRILVDLRGRHPAASSGATSPPGAQRHPAIAPTLAAAALGMRSVRERARRSSVLAQPETAAQGQDALVLSAMRVVLTQAGLDSSRMSNEDVEARYQGLFRGKCGILVLDDAASAGPFSSMVLLTDVICCRTEQVGKMLPRGDDSRCVVLVTTTAPVTVDSLTSSSLPFPVPRHSVAHMRLSMVETKAAAQIVSAVVVIMAVAEVQHVVRPRAVSELVQVKQLLLLSTAE